MSSKIKLSVDCRWLFASGIGRYLRNILHHIVQSQHFDVTCLGKREDLQTFPWFGNVKFVNFEASLFSLKEQLGYVSAIPSSDIFWSPQYNVPVFPIRSKRRVVTIHDCFQLAHFSSLSFPVKAYVKLFSFMATRQSDCILTGSSFSKSQILSLAKAQPSKLQMINYGLDPIFEGFSSSLQESQKEDFLLTVGNLKPHKNIPTIIKAFKTIVKDYPQLKLYIVGKKDGFFTGDHSFDAMIKGVEDKVIFLGSISDAELIQYYRRAKAFVFGSFYEGFGLPVLEAMSFNLPIISSNIPSVYEIAGDSITYFNPSDVNELIYLLKKQVQENTQPNAEEYKAIRQRYSWSASADRHIEIFKGLV
ncbi:MAG: glycosyltransferase family 4 protein [Oligoflexales bacterium]|nr:glycosyltransferase family 4 protein [Oligoflexales bacterium]